MGETDGLSYALHHRPLGGAGVEEGTYTAQCKGAEGFSPDMKTGCVQVTTPDTRVLG